MPLEFLNCIEDVREIRGFLGG